MMRRMIGFGAALLVAMSAIAQAEELSEVEQRLLQDVSVLASDEFEGRGVGTEGINKAAAYIEGIFREAGLNVTVDKGDAFQEFEVSNGAKLEDGNSLELVDAAGVKTSLEMDKSFRTCSFSEPGTFEAEIVFAGYAIETEKYNDFAGIDVKDKVVLFLRRTPQSGDPHASNFNERDASLKTKLSQCYRRGAKAVLILNDGASAKNDRAALEEQVVKAKDKIVELAEKTVLTGEITSGGGNGEPPEAEKARAELPAAVAHLRQLREMLTSFDADPLMEFGYAGEKSGDALPTFHVKRAAVDALIKGATGKTLAEIEASIEETLKPASQMLDGVRATGKASLHIEKVTVKNVIGVLEGEGPLKEETIVVGAHYDHLGHGGDGSLQPGSKEIHNGADDNGSGSAGLLELVRRLAGRKEKLPRRIVFMAFTGEERGLLGSAHYVKTPLFPIEQTVVMFNLDMIGRMEQSKLTVYGTGTSHFWDQRVDEAGAAAGLTLIKKPEGFGPSDHSSFYAKKIPVLHVFGGLHADYHRPSDDVEKLNVPGMRQATDFFETLIVQAAQAPTKPDYIEIQGKAELARTGSRPYFGSIPDFNSDQKGYAIMGTAPGGPSDKAGIKAGDVIIQLGDQKIGSLDDFDLALRKFKAGDQADVTVRREGQEVKLKVTLGQPRG
jgi:Peptidase family M28/PDZ domain